MINEADLNLKEEMIDAGINHDLEAVHTPSLRDPHHIGRDPEDHTQRIGNH